MNRTSFAVVLICAQMTVACVLCSHSPGYAQSLFGFGSDQEQEKLKAERQAPVERAFSEKNYRKLDEKERALAREKYDEFLKESATSKKDASDIPDIQQIKPLELPTDPFQSPDFKAFQGSTK